MRKAKHVKKIRAEKEIVIWLGLVTMSAIFGIGLGTIMLMLERVF